MREVKCCIITIISSGTDEVRAKREPSLCNESVKRHFWFFSHTAVRRARAKIGPSKYKCKRELLRSEAKQEPSLQHSLLLHRPLFIFFPLTAVRGARAKIGPATSVDTVWPRIFKLAMQHYFIGSEIRGYMALTSMTSEAVGGHSTLGL